MYTDAPNLNYIVWICDSDSQLSFFFKRVNLALIRYKPNLRARTSNWYRFQLKVKLMNWKSEVVISILPSFIKVIWDKLSDIWVS